MKDNKKYKDSSCFIHKRTDEIVEVLKLCGYKLSLSHAEGDCIFTYVNYADGIYVYGFVPEHRTKYYTQEEFGVIGGRIDCEKNEMFFLTLASLINKTDKYKLFTDGNISFICPEDRVTHYIVTHDTGVSWDTVHMATIEEIIEYFNK